MYRLNNNNYLKTISSFELIILSSFIKNKSYKAFKRNVDINVLMVKLHLLTSMLSVNSNN